MAAALSIPPSRAAAVTRPSDQSSRELDLMPAPSQLVDRRLREATFQREVARAAPRADRTSSARARCGRRARRSPPAGSCRNGRAAGRRAATTDPADRRPACRTPGRARRRAARARARAWCAAACPERGSRAGPSSSQNIWARVPRQKPSSGITGELCSQPPRRRRRDHVAVAVDDVEMTGVAAPDDRRLAGWRHRRFADPAAMGAGVGDVRLDGVGPHRDRAAVALDLAGAQLERGALADQPPARVVVGVR